MNLLLTDKQMDNPEFFISAIRRDKCLEKLEVYLEEIGKWIAN